MKEIELKDIIKEIILNFESANPLSDEFNEKEFLLIYKKYLNEDFKEFEILNQDKGKEIIDIILELNIVYDAVMRQLEELVDEINLNTIDLIEQVFAIFNYDYFTLKDKLISNIEEDKSRTPKAIDDDSNKKIKNIFGDEIDIHDAADISVDTCNFLLEVIISFQPESDKDIPANSKEKQLTLIRKIILIANVFINIDNAFKFYKYEFGDLKKNGESIVLKHFPEIYYVQQVIGKQRYSSLIQESSFYAFKYFKENRLIPEVRIHNNTVQLLKFKVAEDPHYLISSSLFTTFYFHLHGVKLRYFENVTVIELIELLSALQSCFQHFNLEEILNSTYENQDTKYIPFKIKKNELVQFLVKKTKLKISIVIKALNILSSTFEQIPDLWSTPLIQVVDYYYFILPSLADAHISYLLDKILQKELTSEKQSNIFKQSILNELNQPLKSGYQFELVKEEKLIEIDEELKHNIIILTRDNLILIEILDYPFSIQSTEDYSNIVSLSNASDKLNKKKEILKSNIHKLGIDSEISISGIVMTNYTLYSGLYINYNHIIDFFLLKNYFLVGELKQGKVVYGNSEIHTQELSSLKYYTNEDEFNNNLKEFLFKPAPIFDKIKNYIHKEYLIVPRDMQPQIFRDGIEILPLTSRIGEQIKEVEYYFNQLYYFEKSYDENESGKRFIEDKIKYYLPQIFSLLAFEEDRTIRIDVMNKFKIAHLQSFSYFI